MLEFVVNFVIIVLGICGFGGMLHFYNKQWEEMCEKEDKNTSSK